MNIKITGDGMASASGRHTADLHHFEAGDAWRVSWLPERLMDRNSAITAMTIAEYVAEHDDLAEGHRLWPHVEGWAEELGLTGLEAVSRVRELSQQEMGQ
jgi:hypothetical protein